MKVRAERPKQKIVNGNQFIDFVCICSTVIDDENTNVVTAGAIVTVTVTLVRNNMSELFGNADVAEKQGIK